MLFSGAPVVFALFNGNGLSVADTISSVFELVSLRDEDSGTVFVWERFNPAEEDEDVGTKEAVESVSSAALFFEEVIKREKSSPVSSSVNSSSFSSSLKKASLFVVASPICWVVWCLMTKFA